jgi:nicotinamidase-related amidase
VSRYTAAHRTDEHEEVCDVSEWTLVGKAALVVVHMQNAICKSPSPLDFMGHQRATAEDGLIPRIAGLLAAFREKDLPVLYAVAVHPDEPEGPAYGGFWEALPELVVNQAGTRDVQVVDELAPHDGEPVFENWPFDVLRRTSMEQWLRDHGVETVVLVGVATGMAINIAAYQFADRLFNLIVPSDCVTDGNRELHEAIMEGIMPVISLVTTAEDVIDHL